MLERATTPLGVRCVEYHTVEPGGSLPFPTHFDSSSLITIDVMLSDPSTEFEGGQFSTLEADGTMKEYSHFKKGDALVFVSHKFHLRIPGQCRSTACARDGAVGRRGARLCPSLRAATWPLRSFGANVVLETNAERYCVRSMTRVLV